jgi:hypothetical protein
MTRSHTAPAAAGAAAELPRRDGRTDRRHHRDRGGAEGQAEIGPGPAAPALPRRFSGEGAIQVDQGNPHTAEATKAAQRAGIVSIGPRRDRYGFNSCPIGSPISPHACQQW